MSGEINVLSKTQIIVVEPITGSVSVIQAGAQGPKGDTGPTGPTGPTGADGPAGGIFASHVLLPGSGGSYVSTPDTVANSIAGDLDIRLRVSLDDWTPTSTQRLAAKAGSGVTSWYFQAHTSGVFEFGYTANGSTIVNQASSAHNIPDGSARWVRVTLDADNGASGHVVAFYTAPDSPKPPANSEYTLLSTHTVAAVASIFDSSRDVSFGGNSDGTSLVAGKIYRGMIYNGIGGTLINDFNPSRAPVAGTTLVAKTGETWTLAGSASFGGGDDGAASMLGPLALVICTSTTRPANPTPGQHIFETDTGYLLIYYSATTGWRPPWNTAWGTIANPVNVTANVNGVQGGDITGLAITWNAVKNRRYKVCVEARMENNSANVVTDLQITTSGGTVVQGANITSSAVNADMWFTPVAFIDYSSAAGSVTYKTHCIVSGGTVNLIATSTEPARIWVEDMGPIGAPA